MCPEIEFSPFNPQPVDPQPAQNTKNISDSDAPFTKLGKKVRSGTNNVGNLLNNTADAVKKHSVIIRGSSFLDKCAKFFQKIGSLLNLCDSPEVEIARKNAKAIKLGTEGLLQCFRDENTEIEGQVQLLQSHLKENGKRLGTTETLILKNKIVENGKVIDMCETRIDELKAKLKETTDVGCQLHLMKAVNNLAKLATETHKLSLEIMKLLSGAEAPNLPNIRNVPDPDASAQTIAEKRVLLNTNEASHEEPSVGTTDNLKTAEDASPSRPHLEPSWHEKAKKVLQQPKGQGNPAPFETFLFGHKRSVPDPKTSSLKPIPEEEGEEEIRNPKTPFSGSKKPSGQKIGKGNRIAFKGTEKQKKDPKQSAREKSKAYSENVVAEKLKGMKTDNTFDASKNNWNTTNKFQTDASGNKGITFNSGIQKQLNQLNDPLKKF